MSDPRRGFSRLPTAPVNLPTTLSGPGVEDDLPEWEPVAPAVPAASSRGIDRGYAGWALGFAISGLVVSLVVGWGFVIGVVAIVAGVLALLHPRDSRAVAIWAIVLASVSLIYSAGWFVFAWTQLA